MEGVLALVRLYQRFTFTLNDQKHGGKPLEHESLITLMPKVQHKHAFQLDVTAQAVTSIWVVLSSSLMLLSDQLHDSLLSKSFTCTLLCSTDSHEVCIFEHFTHCCVLDAKSVWRPCHGNVCAHLLCGWLRFTQAHAIGVSCVMLPFCTSSCGARPVVLCTLAVRVTCWPAIDCRGRIHSGVTQH